MTTEMPMNIVEHREWMNDQGGFGNNNFSVISTYKGPISTKLLKSSLHQLAKIHPYLRFTIKVSDLKPKFIELPKLEIPIREYSYEGLEQWRAITKKDLHQKFQREDQPLWRVSLIKGENEGHIIVTFHHAIADGVCAPEIVNHLYKIMSASLLNREANINVDFSIPPLETIFDKVAKTPESLLPLEPLKDYPILHSAHVTQVLDESITKKIIEYARKQGLKVHSVLFATLLKSILKYKKPASDTFFALTITNLRQYFPNPISKEENYFTSKENMMLSANTFQGKLHLGIVFLEEYSKSEEFQAILQEMQDQLSKIQ